uniref:Uncharacterized protein n=1 Tax=Mesocestoides corti TaxID=53468 RepID=A0A5K3G0J2_MESCO
MSTNARISSDERQTVDNTTAFCVVVAQRTTLDGVSTTRSLLAHQQNEDNEFVNDKRTSRTNLEAFKYKNAIYAKRLNCPIQWVVVSCQEKMQRQAYWHRLRHHDNATPYVEQRKPFTNTCRVPS